MNLYLFNEAIGMAKTYGIGVYLRELVHALEGSGINIFIVHLFSERQKFEIETVQHSSLTCPVENWYIPKGHIGNASYYTLQLMEYYYRNVAYLLRSHIKDTGDLVFHFNFNLCSVLARELKVAFNCKTVAAVHYTNWHVVLYGNLSIFHEIKAKPEAKRNNTEQEILDFAEKEKSFFMEIDRVIALSRHMYEILENEYQIDSDKISVIPNGLVDASPKSPVDKAGLRRKWNFSENESLILFAGRLDQVKGITFLIRAFRDVLPECPDCRLIIAGDGDFDICVKEIKDICARITFTGFIARNELHALYQIADVGVVPSLYEPFGYVAAEMMMHGLPIVATTTSGLNEVVDETCGLKVPVTELPDKMDIDTSLLAQKILHLLQHPAEAKRLGGNARKRYLEKYAMPVYRKNMLDFYQSLFVEYKENKIQ